MLGRIPVGAVVAAVWLPLCGLLGLAQPCAAQLTEAKKQQLLKLSDQAKEALGQRDFPSPQQRAAAVAAAADELVVSLRQRAGNAWADSWLRYLKTDELVEAIHNDRPAAEIQTHARALQGRLVGTAVGLEMPPLVKLREANERLLQAARYGSDDQSAAWVSAQLAALDRQLRGGDPERVPNDAAALSLLTQYLDQSNQAVELAGALADEFSQPNLLVSVGGQAVEDWISRSIDRQQAINDCILGTRVLGQGQMTGRLVGRLTHGKGCVGIELVLTGQFRSQSVGYNRSVQLPSVGHGAVNVSRTLAISERSVSLSSVSDSVSLQTQVTAVQHPLRLVRRIAAKQVARQHPQAEAIARQRFRTQVVDDFTQQTQSAVQEMDASGRRLDRVERLMTRLNLQMPVRSLNSTPTAIRFQATQRNGKQLAAAAAADPWAPPATGVGVQLHESLIDNLATSILAGRTMTNKQIDRLLSDLGQVREPSAEAASEEDFAIRFATLRPIIFEAREQELRIGLRGTQFSRGGENVLGAVEITFVYRPVAREDGSLFLERVGDVRVEFPGKSTLTIGEVAERRAIQRLFEGRVPAQLLDQPMYLPSTLAVPALQGSQVHVAELTANNGWLAVGVVPR